MGLAEVGEREGQLSCDSLSSLITPRFANISLPEATPVDELRMRVEGIVISLDKAHGYGRA